MRVAIILLILVVGFFWLAQPEDKSLALKAAAAKEAEVKRSIAQQNRLLSVKIAKFSWEKAGFDNVLIASFTIQNTNDFPVKDINVRCDLTATSGTEVGAATQTIFRAVKANGSKAVHRFNMGLINNQAARSSCHVIGFANG